MQKLADASEQLTVLNEKLAIQRVAVKEKTEACEILLEEISAATQKAEEKKSQAVVKGKEIAEQSNIIESEKVGFAFLLFTCYYNMFSSKGQNNF